jgi:hypothetical protein
VIHVVEVPWEGRPLAWFAFDEDDLIGKIRVRRADAGQCIHAVASARELLATSGAAPDASPDWIAELAARYGWDTHRPPPSAWPSGRLTSPTKAVYKPC